ncbi:L-arabinose isomerase [Melioribacter sp. OK-6-Me]|uniref:L-arabinose isomerase n=1 Tax=unclassified Melioribacter TaxID=2627329 RepID=UPI003EDAD4D0
MVDINKYEIWFATGSQHLYGQETLAKVKENSTKIVNELNADKKIPIKIVFKDVLTTPDAIANLTIEANSNVRCAGLIFWMHTFSPAKMWIRGLNLLNKPFLHLHTQFNRDIPWDSIDMDFMNLNQAAHGDREFGFICTRMGLNRKVVTGHWQDPNVIDKISIWIRAAIAWADSQGARIARFGDNMRDVAVTEGDKVEAQIKLGYSVYGFGVGDLVEYVNKTNEKAVKELIEVYKRSYNINAPLSEGDNNYRRLFEAAKIEIGLRSFLEEVNFVGFTTTFEDLHGLSQLPGIAVQRLMAEGYGFGAEGDWKTAALVRAVKVMSVGLKGGTSFMEDYTYHFDPLNPMVLGAHMLEVCESIAADKPTLEIHPLSIGGKDDPPRLVFDVAPGNALNASLIDMGNRFRLIVNNVNVVKTEHALPKLPVARALWKPEPNLHTAATAWIYAGGAHHTCFSQSITSEYLYDFAEIAGIEFLLIDNNTDIIQFKNQLKWNEIYYSGK